MAGQSGHPRTLTAGRDPVWLVSGSVHYFRIPATQWRDRLTKAKWAGLNSIETPVPWNLHEVRPDKFEFRRDNDLEAFLKTAHEAGLYAVVRIGPYVRADWDYGGLPADIASDPVLAAAAREASPAFLKRVEPWFDELLPRLAKLQAGKGGPVLALTVEHEYFFPERPHGPQYLQWLLKKVRAAKIDVPVFTNTGFLVKTKGLPEVWSDGDDIAGGVARLREEQPDQPRIFLHLPTGGSDKWGADRRSLRKPRAVAAAGLRVLSEGGMFNWSPFAGGTNFGHWAGRAGKDDSGFLTTSADGDAPISEGGGLTLKYHQLRRVNLLAASLARFLPSSEVVRLKVELPPGFTAVARRAATPGGTGGSASPSGLGGANLTGTLLTVFRDEGAPDQWADVGLAGGVVLPLDFTRDDALPLVVDFRLGKRSVVDYCNCPLLAVWLDRFAIFHGPAGAGVVASFNGKLQEFKIPAGNALEWRDAGDGNFAVFLNTETADSTWLDAKLGLIIGAERPGNKVDQFVESVAGEGVVVIGRDANPVRHECRPKSSVVPRPARKVGNWRRLTDIPEIKGDGDGWKKLAGPADGHSLGVPRGPLWYRMVLNLERKRSLALLPAGLEDRAMIWADGKFVGTFGRGPGATREPLPLDLDIGRRTVTMLVDQLGRFSRRFPPEDRKGLFEHVFTANSLHLSQPSRPPVGTLPKDIKPVWTVERVVTPDPARMTLCEMHFGRPQGSHVLLECKDLPEPCWIYINDRFVTFFHGRHQAGFMSRIVPSPTEPLNRLRIYFPSPHARNVTDRFRILDLAENISAAAEWAFKPLLPPDPAGERWSKEMKDDQRLRWYCAQFPELKPDLRPDEPVVLSLPGLLKGQVWLNGRCLGRYWNSAGPQTRMYVPDGWLGKENDLLVLEEEGKVPAELSLDFESGGVYGDVHAAALHAADHKHKRHRSSGGNHGGHAGHGGSASGASNPSGSGHAPVAGGANHGTSHGTTHGTSGGAGGTGSANAGSGTGGVAGSGAGAAAPSGKLTVSTGAPAGSGLSGKLPVAATGASASHAGPSGHAGVAASVSSAPSANAAVTPSGKLPVTASGKVPVTTTGSQAKSTARPAANPPAPAKSATGAHAGSQDAPSGVRRSAAALTAPASTPPTGPAKSAPKPAGKPRR